MLLAVVQPRARRPRFQVYREALEVSKAVRPSYIGPVEAWEVLMTSRQRVVAETSLMQSSSLIPGVDLEIVFEGLRLSGLLPYPGFLKHLSDSL